MACIIGLLDMLLMENLTIEHEGSVRQIHRCATSLVSLLNSALDIAKVFSVPYCDFLFFSIFFCGFTIASNCGVPDMSDL
jgi:hypothetical protein